MPGSIKALRLLNLILGNGITGANLEAELADAAKLGAFKALLRQRAALLSASAAMGAIADSSTAMGIMAASNTAMTAVAASNTAMTTLAASSTGMGIVAASSVAMGIVAASSVAMTALAASSTGMGIVAASSTTMGIVAASSVAMGAVAASSTAMGIVAASSVAKMACFNSDTALIAIAASATAMAACRAAAQYSVASWTENGTSAVALALTGTSHIVLGASRSTSGPARTNTLTTLRAGSAISAVTPNTLVSASAAAADFNVAIPLISPRSVALSGTGTGTSYLGILRCDL